MTNLDDHAKASNEQPTIQQGLIILEDFLDSNLSQVLKQAKNIKDILAGTVKEVKQLQDRADIKHVTNKTMAEKLASDLQKLNAMVMDIGETLHYIEHQIK